LYSSVHGLYKCGGGRSATRAVVCRQGPAQKTEHPICREFPPRQIGFVGLQSDTNRAQDLEHFKDGTLSCVGKYSNGEKVGEWRTYGTKGEPTKTMRHEL